MADAPPAKTTTGKTPTGPKVSGARTLVSLIVLVVVMIVCVIELRAGLGHYLTLKAFNKEAVSQNNLFKSVSFEAADGMVSAFPSKSPVKEGDHEDVHHYYWFSLLRPLMGEGNPELFITSDHAEPKNAVSFYTSTEGEVEHLPYDPNAKSSAPPMGMPGMSGMPGMPGGGSSMGGGGSHDGGDQKRGGGDRPALEEENAAPKSDAAPNDAGSDPVNTPAGETTETGADASPEPVTEGAKSDASAEPK